MLKLYKIITKIKLYSRRRRPGKFTHSNQKKKKKLSFPKLYLYCNNATIK